MKIELITSENTAHWKINASYDELVILHLLSHTVWRKHSFPFPYCQRGESLTAIYRYDAIPEGFADRIVKAFEDCPADQFVAGLIANLACYRQLIPTHPQ